MDTKRTVNSQTVRERPVLAPLDANVNYLVLDRENLPRQGKTYEFQGYQFLNTEVSIIWVDMPPGVGVRLHQHPYKEIFVIQEGSATYTVGPVSLEAHAGQIVIVPAGTPHRFVNSGECALKQVDIHLSRQFITDWLEG